MAHMCSLSRFCAFSLTHLGVCMCAHTGIMWITGNSCLQSSMHIPAFNGTCCVCVLIWVCDVAEQCLLNPWGACVRMSVCVRVCVGIDPAIRQDGDSKIMFEKRSLHSHLKAIDFESSPDTFSNFLKRDGSMDACAMMNERQSNLAIFSWRKKWHRPNYNGFLSSLYLCWILFVVSRATVCPQYVDRNPQNPSKLSFYNVEDLAFDAIRAVFRETIASNPQKS